MIREVVTRSDIWQASLLAHLAAPMLTYDLPGIDTTGLRFSPMYNNDGPTPGGRDTNSAQIFPAGSNGPVQMVMQIKDSLGNMHPVRQLEYDRQMESNYHRFNGWINTQIPLQSDPGEWNSVVVFFPDDPVRPIIHINYLDGSSPYQSGATASAWTASPFVVDQGYVTFGPTAVWPNDSTVGRSRDQRSAGRRDDSSDRWSTVSGSTDKDRRPHSDPSRDGSPARAPSYRFDATNMYFVGGAELATKMIGLNAFTSYSCLARDDSHTVTRFWTAEDTVVGGPSEPTFDYGATQQFSADHNVGYAAYTGSKWGVSMSWDSFDDTVAADMVRKALNVGYPFIHYKYSVPQGSGTTPYLQVLAQTWLGIAPTSIAVAGSATHRTIPLTMPAWTSYCRARGSTGIDTAGARQGAGRNVFKTLRSIPTDSKVVTALSAEPDGGHAKVSSMASKIATGAVDAGALAVSLIPGVGSVLKPLVSAAGNAMVDQIDEA